MLRIKRKFLYQVNIFDISFLLNKVNENNIKIYELKKIGKYTYSFYASIKVKSKLEELFPSLTIIRSDGLFSSVCSMIKYKTTIISMILSVFFYISLSNRIWVINISGDSLNLVEFIDEKLKSNNIYVGCKKINVNELSNIQNNILYSSYDIIEYLSIKSNGSLIDVSFKQKRKETQINQKKGNLYASKDGMIKSFDLLSGEKVVKINDYVKKGDLLVKDVLTTDYNEEVYIGTFGSVYAYTWYYVNVEHKISDESEKETMFANMLLQAKDKISYNFTDDEYIYEENVLQFNISNNIVNMKVHFTCVEDIAKE